MNSPRRAPVPQGRPAIMGILNVTPDSFSDGGKYHNLGDAIAHAVAMTTAGANIIDVGGESTRPGAERLRVEEEKARVLPIIRELVARDILVSIDTMNASTAAAAVELGAVLINDVSGGLADRGMREVVAESNVDYVAMHWRGHSDTMNSAAVYDDVVHTVRNELKYRIAELIITGVHPNRIILDPGLGFAKNAKHNWQLLGRLRELETLGHRVLIGASRKSFLSPFAPDFTPASERDPATATISALAAESGAWGVRVHDVAGTLDALKVWEAWNAGRAPAPLALGAGPTVGGKSVEERSFASPIATGPAVTSPTVSDPFAASPFVEGWALPGPARVQRPGAAR